MDEIIIMAGNRTMVMAGGEISKLWKHKSKDQSLACQILGEAKDTEMVDHSKEGDW